MNNKIQKIVILGGGTSGWSVAAALSRVIDPNDCSIHLIESDAIGIIGVGEASIPPMQEFHKIIGFNEVEFIKSSQASFKLGIEFSGWGSADSRYFHPFGSYGREFDSVAFHQYWLRAQNYNLEGELDDYSLCSLAAQEGKFTPSNNDPNSLLSSMGYAYHFDATLYAKSLRTLAQGRGVCRHEGKAIDVNLRPSDGFIESIKLESGEVIDGDLFIDCSGFASLLLGKTLGVGFDDWSDFLPANRAVAVATENHGATLPYTQSTAHAAGWQWRIPLQHRCGNGFVYSDRFISDDEATQCLLANINGKPVSEPRILKFNTGRRKQPWHKNCVAMGLAAGFMEPLESTAIHLVQSSISRLLTLFPGKEFCQADINEYNQQTQEEYHYIRDFIILHYHANNRNEPLWRYCRQMQIPDSLAHRIDLFKNRGRLIDSEEDLFKKPSWLAVMLGQGIQAKAYDPIADYKPEARISQLMQDIRHQFRGAVEAMPSHDQFIKDNCKAPPINH